MILYAFVPWYGLHTLYQLFGAILLSREENPCANSKRKRSKETFVAEVEIIKSEMEASEVTVDGEYMSQDKMEELGYSEPLVLFQCHLHNLIGIDTW